MCMPLPRLELAEDAAVRVVVVELGAVNVCRPTLPYVQFRRREHPQERRCAVNPQRCPVLTNECRGERPRRVQAHPRKRPLERECKETRAAPRTVRYTGQASACC